MKRQINTLLTLLFIISTLTTSLHELLPHHNSSDCQVCTVSEHSSALLPEANTLQKVDVSDHAPVLSLADQYQYRYIPTCGPRAPPVFS